MLTEEVKKLKETQLSLRLQLKSLFTVYGRSTLIAVSLLGLQMLIGINTAMYYGPLIMEKSGITFEDLTKDESALILNIPLAFTNFAGTTCNVFMIDRFGRRSLMLGTLPLMATFWTIAAIGMCFTGEGQNPPVQAVGGYLAIVAIHLFVFVFGMGISSTPWTVTSEIFPLHLIGTASSLGAASNWVNNAVIAQLFKVVSEINLAARVILYLVLGMIAAGTFVFVYYLVPETAGKSIE